MFSVTVKYSSTGHRLVSVRAVFLSSNDVPSSQRYVLMNSEDRCILKGNQHISPALTLKKPTSVSVPAPGIMLRKRRERLIDVSKALTHILRQSSFDLYGVYVHGT